jgi:amino acid adenylation domain-containing protein
MTATIQGFQLSLQQEHLWAQQQGTPNAPFGVCGQIAINGPIQHDTLAKALQTLIQRHEIFRTTFSYPPSMTLPVQMISTEVTLNHQILDLTSLEPEDQSMQLEVLWQQWIDPAQERLQTPPWQSLLVMLSAKQLILLVRLSPLYGDTVTLNRLATELSQCYQATLAATPITDEPLQYADFAAWQQGILEASESNPGKVFWQNQAYEGVHRLRLPFEDWGSQQTGFTPQSIPVTLGPEQTTQLAILAQTYGVSTSTLLLTCWCILLWRWLDQPHIIIGTAFTGRKYAELETILGNLTKHLPLVQSYSTESTFLELLKDIDHTLEKMYQWQDCFTWDETLLPVEKQYWPIAYEYHSQTAPTNQGNLSFSLRQQFTCLEQFKLKLACTEGNQTLTTVFHYDANCLQASVVQEIAAQFHQLLVSALAQPNSAIHSLDLLHNRQQLLGELNQTQTPYPKDVCIHHLISDQAQEFPTGIAITWSNQQLTYEDLEQRSNQLAHHLQQLGVGPDVLVGLYIERSPLMIIGMLGILKAGGAYVPLDPSYPKARLAFMLEDAQVTVLLTQQSLLYQLPTQAPQGLCLDTDWEAINHHPTAPVTSAVTPTHLAYVIYTSGSTGQPKGVQITHQNLVHSTYARILTYPLSILRFLLLSSFAFDSSVAGIFWSLCQGGELHLPETGLERDPAGLIAVIADHQISHLLTLPSLYSLILEGAKPQQLTSLQTVIVAGEVCPAALVRTHQAQLPDTELFNEYGPTEGTVWSTVYRCFPVVPSHPTVCKVAGLTDTVPIGRPIPNAEVYILDDQGQPVPMGVRGELYLGGVGIARGYLHQPELTQQRFIPHPFRDDGYARLYRTGDLARYRPDGEIEFCGRRDDQIKLRGFRIELAEIEATIAQYPAVLETIVMVREDSPGDQRLVAYLRPQPDVELELETLRPGLREILPDYMIPSAFIVLKTFPRTPNGKIDRQALPSSTQTQSERATAFIAPRTATEVQLVEIWTETLKVNAVGIHDNFFDLGGHSLLATQLASRCRDTFQVEISLRQFFAAPTIADLATLITQQLANAVDETFVAKVLADIQQLSEEEAQAMLAVFGQEDHQ